jgi:NADH-quinone oxidoreductase subunit E
MGKDRGGSVAMSGRECLLGMIKREQARSGYISEGAIREMAESLSLSVSDVYGVTTFYSFLSTQPLGKHVIRICKGVPCFLRNAGMIIDAIQEELGIGPGETTADGRFSFELTNCIGACDQAPAMLVDDEVYGHLTAEKISEILKSYD